MANDDLTSKIPVNADHTAIGKKVSIQVFERRFSDEAYRIPDAKKDQIDPNTLEKYIGILEALVILQDQIIIKLHGCDAESFLFDDLHVEIYIHE